MATGTGLDRQIGYAVESTYGTGVTVTRFLPVVDESLAKEINPTESEGQIAGALVRRSTQWKQGDATVGGDVSHELYDQSLGLLLRCAFGTVTTAGTAVPYSHTFWPVATVPSFTTQKGVPATYGTVVPLTYTGCKIQSWEWAMAAGENATWGMTLLAQEETMGTALAAVSMASNITPWHARYGTLSIDGTLVPTKSFSIGGENNLSDDRRYLGSTVIADPLRADLAVYSGEFEAEWGNVGTAAATYGTSLYQKFLEGTEGTLIQTLVSGTLSGTITANIRFDGSTPVAGDNGITMHTVPYTCIAAGTLDSGAITVVIRNNDSTA
jgi:hypothetical protein